MKKHATSTATPTAQELLTVWRGHDAAIVAAEGAYLSARVIGARACVALHKAYREKFGDDYMIYGHPAFTAYEKVMDEGNAAYGEEYDLGRIDRLGVGEYSNVYGRKLGAPETA